ncbi:MAG: hypothetical protein AAFW89_08560, partial [Bacteroidota bacterium]
DFAKQTLLTQRVDAVHSLSDYHVLGKKGVTVLDGGLGELARRRYLTRLRYIAASSIRDRNWDALLPFFILERPSLFTNDVDAMMRKGLQEELHRSLGAMPPVAETGLEHWLDLFSLRTRVPNTAFAEQSRADGILRTLMPLIQPEVVKALLNLPLKQRRHARWIKTWLKHSHPQLSRVPLIKDHNPYPFWMNDIQSRIYRAIRKPEGFTSTIEHRLLDSCMPWIQDQVHSSSFRSFEGYNHERITGWVDGYIRRQETHHASAILWWMTFELFRGE